MEMILEKYNYWVAIVLMMTGLYVVISRGNLVKTLIGLNLFQTSVFIFYITIGKVAGGTAPILAHEEPNGAGHGETPHPQAGHETGASHLVVETSHAGAGPKPDMANDLNSALAHGGEHAAQDLPENSLHASPEDVALESNDLFSQTNSDIAVPGGEATLHTAPALTTLGNATEGMSSELVATAYADLGSLGDGSAQVIYTNPLPHVLMLTAIVVGVATTAVGLALAVRIREAYGTIEEDELEASDHLAEFGRAPGAPLAQGGAE